MVWNLLELNFVVPVVVNSAMHLVVGQVV